VRTRPEVEDERGLTAEQQLLVEAYAMKSDPADVPEAWRLGA